MIALPTLSRTGVAAASLLLTGILLAVPFETHGPPHTNVALGPQLAGAPAMAMDEPAAAALRADAADPVEPAPAARHSDRAPAPQLGPGAAGMVVGIDPETGELGMPTPEQLKTLSDSPQHEVDHSAAGLLEVHHPDGSVSVDLQGRFQEYATVRIGPDGKLIFRCVDGKENAKRAVESSTPAPGTPALEER